MKKVARKRLGRPPGRKAPRRPVVSARVPEALYEKIKDEARANGRTMGEELVWRAESIYEWQRAFADAEAIRVKGNADARAILDKANQTTAEVLKIQLHNALRGQGYTRVRGVEGAAWFEPGVHAIKWIFAEVDPESRMVLQEMLDLAATRAIEKSKEA